MYVCLCNAVTQRQVEDCARAGVSSVEELTAQLGVGAGCGRCRDCATELLAECCSGTSLTRSAS
jgi:bacterioferritin-associated ferredoxin